MSLFDLIKKNKIVSKKLELTDYVQLLKSMNDKQLIKCFSSTNTNDKPFAIPYTADAVQCDINAIRKYAINEKALDSDIAAAISIIMCHLSVQSAQKYLTNNGYSAPSKDKMIYIGTYIASIKSLEELQSAGITKYKISCVCDQRTCKVCKSHSEKKYMVSKAVIGKNVPPFCDSCRCCIMAVF